MFCKSKITTATLPKTMNQVVSLPIFSDFLCVFYERFTECRVFGFKITRGHGFKNQNPRWHAYRAEKHIAQAQSDPGQLAYRPIHHVFEPRPKSDDTGKLSRKIGHHRRAYVPTWFLAHG